MNTAPLGNVESKVRSRIVTWSDELLQLDRRNRLLYFHHVKVGSVAIDAAPAKVLDLMASAQGATFVEGLATDETDVLPVPGPRSLVAANKTRDDLPRALKNLATTSSTAFMERGVWILYVGLGMLSWIDDDDREARSPLLLVPVMLKRDRRAAGYRLTSAEEDAVFNPTLLHKLTTTYRMSFDPDADSSYDDIRTEVKGLVAGQPGWSVSDDVVLSTFSFHKEAMYKDLRDNIDIVASHPIVQLLAAGPDAPSSADYDFEKFDLRRLDTVAAPEDVPTILDADATQMRCILHARDGRSFVMDGPPGSGKSQTIANMIATLIADGRTVLFVSEKMAALEVVRKRLDAHHLGDFVLELHSHKATRKQVAETLGRALKTRPAAKPPHRAPKRGDVAAMRGSLDAFAHTLNHRNTSLGMSLFEALTDLNRLHEFQAYAVGDPSAWYNLYEPRFFDITTRVRQLANAWGPVDEDDTWVWRDLARTDQSPGEIRDIESMIAAAHADATELRHLIDAVDTDFGLRWGGSDSDVQRRIELLRLLDRGVSVPRHWLAADDLSGMSQRANQLRGATGVYRAADQRLKTVIGPDWGAVDGTPVADVRQAVETLRDADRGPCDVSEATAPELTEQAKSLRLAAEALEDADVNALGLARSFGMEFDSGMSLADTRRVAAMGSLASTPVRPEPEWLNPMLQRAVVESTQILSELVRLVRDRQESLGKVFTPAVLDLDLAGMHLRFEQVHTGLRRWSSAARQDRKALAAATVLGKANRETIARLDEAVAWQELENRLTQAEREHAEWLGGRYRRTETDFGRIGQAIDVACKAVELAGDHINVQAITRQLATTGEPDVDLEVRTRRVHRAVEEITIPSLESAVGTRVVGELADLPLAAIVAWCRAGADVRENLAAEIAKIDVVAGRNLSVATGVEVLHDAVAADDALRVILERPEEDKALLGDRYADTETDWEAWQNDLTWAEAVRTTVAQRIDDACATRLLRPSFAASDLSDAYAAWIKGRHAIESLFVEPQRFEIGVRLSDLDTADELLVALEAEAVDQITTWQRYVHLTTDLAEAGLSEVIGRAITTRLPGDHLEDAFHHALLQAWVSCQTTSPMLEPLDSDSRDDLVHRYRTDDAAITAKAYVDVVNACGSRRPTSSVGQPAIIERQGNLKAKHLPIRELMGRAGQTARILKPCFMMSPLAVSQYLPPTMRFDVVIFDEASQVLPSDAINCVYRGNQLIVAGDVKQLPPTQFFARQIDASEDEAIVDDDAGEFESVLDLAKGSAGLPSLPLQWHYRSRHEALIAFSNRQFYDDELRTFPGAYAKAPDLGVVGIKVDGVYERGGSKHNLVEAEEVVDRVLHHHRVHRDMSIGVVAFSSEQASAITAALERRAATHPEIAGILDTTDRLEGFFVKNLENVQGDERDIIVFSIGYGRDETGRLIMNFGPLNREGGWRRLNVAITRARRRVEVVTSITAHEPEFERVKSNRAIRALQNYLAYALHENAQDGGGRRSSRRREATSPFGDVVAATLEQHGYEVDRNVGMASVTVDVAVKDPNDDGHYVLGILTDGPEYSEVGATRDRERLQPDVLRQLGWRLHRAWSHAWYVNRVREESRLLSAIDAALHGGADDVTPVPVASAADEPSQVIEYSEVELSDVPVWAQPYEVGFGRAQNWDATKPGSLVYLRDFLESVIEAESPVHVDLLAQRVRDNWANQKVSAALRQAVAKALTTSHKVTVDDEGFAWWPGSKVEPRYPTTPQAQRDARIVHRAELTGAVVNLVRDAGAADDDEIIQAAARVFGWRRTGPDIRAALDRAIDDALADGTLRRENGTLQPGNNHDRGDQW